MLFAMMQKAGFTMNGLSKIYYTNGTAIECNMAEATGADLEIVPQRRQKDIRFYGEDIAKRNWLFRQFILKPDTRAGIKMYEEKR